MFVPISRLTQFTISFGLAFILILAPNECLSINQIIVARFENCACSDYIDGSWHSEMGSDKFSIIIAGINTDKPAIRGNMGTSPLIQIPSGNPKVLYYIEATGLGNINLFSIFTDKSAITYTKNYCMASGNPYSMVCTGRFE